MERDEMNSDSTEYTNTASHPFPVRIEMIDWEADLEDGCITRDQADRIVILHGNMTVIADRLLTVWVRKVMGYGTSRYDRHDIDFDLWMNFSDVYRKMIRLEQVTKNGDTEAAVRIYADLANYAMSAILVLREHLEGDESDA